MSVVSRTETPDPRLMRLDRRLYIPPLVGRPVPVRHSRREPRYCEAWMDQRRPSKQRLDPYLSGSCGRDLAIKGWLAPYTPLAAQIEKQINDVGGGMLSEIATRTESNTIRFI